MISLFSHLQFCSACITLTSCLVAFGVQAGGEKLTPPQEIISWQFFNFLSLRRSLRVAMIILASPLVGEADNQMSQPKVGRGVFCQAGS